MTRSLRIWLPAIRAGSGADVFVQRLALGLERAGHQPHAQWFDHRYELAPWRLRSFDAPYGTDVVHANSWQGFAFKRPGIPLVVTEHQYVAHPAFAPYQGRLQGIYHRRFIHACMRRSFSASAAVVTVSEFCAEAMRLDLDRRVRVIHNWVDSEHFSPIASTSSQLGADRTIRLLFVGNPSRWKGADILPAVARELGEGYEVQCLGGLRKGFDLAQLPPNMKLLPRVEMDEMPSVYRSADIALVPTRYEAFGYVALEAMACGLPVVGFDSAGTKEVCVHGETALLAPLDDVRKLIAYVRQLADDRVLLRRLGEAGRHRAVSEFSAIDSVSAYIDTYQAAISHEER